MANHASAIKRNRQRVKRTIRNRAVRSALRTEVKKANTAISTTPKEAADLVKAAHTALDRAASKNVIPKRRASRLKSRMARAANKAAAA